MNRVDDLWEYIVSAENCDASIDDVNASHHWHNHHTPNRCTAWVQTTQADRVEDMQTVMENGFVQAPFKLKRRYDPSAQKWRDTNEPRQWPDQYIHHALIRGILPVLMRGMDKYCCGSIKKRGTSYGRDAIERWMQDDPKGTRYCLQCDIYHFYPSLQPEVVMARMRELIKDARVLDLIWRIIKDGIKIGAYPSQWFANTTLQPLDHLIREGGFEVKHYIRNMDNITVFASSKRKLRKLHLAIEKWLNAHGLRLKGDWQIFRTAKDRPITQRHPKGRMPQALGFRYGHSYTIPRKRNLLRLKRQIARYRRRRDRKKPIAVRMALGLLSRLGQLKHCNNYRLHKLLLRGERLQRQLKNIVRAFVRRKELLTWNTYLERRTTSRSSRQRAASTPA